MTSRNLVPYLLLCVLTLGTGLAIGLGVSEGPVTYSAAVVPQFQRCSASRTTSGVALTCTSTSVAGSYGDEPGSGETVWSSPIGEYHPRTESCLNRAADRFVPTGPTSPATFNRELAKALATCGVP